MYQEAICKKKKKRIIIEYCALRVDFTAHDSLCRQKKAAVAGSTDGIEYGTGRKIVCVSVTVSGGWT